MQLSKKFFMFKDFLLFSGLLLFWNMMEKVEVFLLVPLSFFICIGKTCTNFQLNSSYQILLSCFFPNEVI